VQDASCPTDYPVCGPAGKCIAGTPTAASVAITGVDGHAAADYLSGTVRVLVSARATSGVRSVTLASGSMNFPTSTAAAAAPLYAFDVNTTALTDGDATLTATLTAGDNSGATATGTLHVDNVKPVITSFTAAGLPSTTITAGTTAFARRFLHACHRQRDHHRRKRRRQPDPDQQRLRTGEPRRHDYVHCASDQRSGVMVQSGTTASRLTSPCRSSQTSILYRQFHRHAERHPAGQTGTFTFTAPTFGGSPRVPW